MLSDNPPDVDREEIGVGLEIVEYAPERLPGYAGAAGYRGMGVNAFAQQGFQLLVFADTCVGKHDDRPAAALHVVDGPEIQIMDPTPRRFDQISGLGVDYAPDGLMLGHGRVVVFAG